MRKRIRIAIACAGLLLVTAASARAQTTFRETGSVTVGGYLVWVRGTNAKVVELFVGRGFRDAFAKAHEMDAAKLQQWIDSVRAVTPVSPDDSTSADAQLRGSALGTDVTMMRRVGGSFSGLRLLVSGEEPIRMAEPTARDFIAMLDSAAHVTRELSVPPPTIMASMPMQIAAPVADAPAIAMTIASTPAPAAMLAPAAMPAPMLAPIPAPIPMPMPAPVPVAPRPVVSAPLIGVAWETPVSAPSPSAASVPPATVMGPSIADPPPELVLPAPREPVALLASREEILPLPMLAITPRPPARVVAQRVVDEPVTATAPASAPPVAAPVAVPVAAPTPITQVAAASLAPTPAPDTAAPPHADAPSDKLIHTPLGPFTIPGALLSDRDKQAQYCYTQLGLKYNPDLKGEITVKLLLGSDGAVQDAVVTKRSWQGISAGEVESCVRALAHDWTFASSDPSVTDGSKLLTFSFAP